LFLEYLLYGVSFTPCNQLIRFSDVEEELCRAAPIRMSNSVF
jgi:hypothetical protein